MNKLSKLKKILKHTRTVICKKQIDFLKLSIMIPASDIIDTTNTVVHTFLIVFAIFALLQFSAMLGKK